MANLHTISGIALVIVVLLYLQHGRKRTKLNLPPGPKPIPILGNIRDLPPKDMPEYQHWLKHKDLYGPVSSVTVLGSTMVVIHDRQAAQELLEKTAKKTSGRPILEFASRLCGFERFLPAQQFDDTYRWHRRLIHQHLGSNSAVSRYHDIVTREVQHFLVRIQREPENLVKLFKTVTGAVILKITYGYSIEQEKNDDLVDLIEKMMINLSFAFVPLAWMVDIIPGLRYLPSNLPWMKFKKTAKECNRINREVAEVPFLFTQRQMASQNPRPSYVAKLLGESKERGVDESDEKAGQLEEAIKSTAAIMFAGGADTTASNLSSFLLAMVCFPEVQRKAQQEIDDVVGPDRLPRFEDRAKMPYTEGLVKETLRWLPVVPMGTAHASTEATTCGGYDIPKGAQLVPAIWWFTHDPQVHRDPDAFDPERYSSPRNEPDPRSVVFGFGRRVCPGKLLADASLFFIVSNILAVFSISKAVDEKGSEIDVKLEATAGLITHPVDFPYRIRPRNAQKADMLRKIQDENPWEGGDAELLKEVMTSRA